MSQRYITLIILFLSIGLTTPVLPQDTGLVPVPVFTNAGVGTEVAYHAGTNLYTYSYTITNPSTNTGEIWSIDIDISRPRYSISLSSDGLTIPHGFITDSFDESLADFSGDVIPMVPVGLAAPSEWSGTLGAGGTAGFCCGTHIKPGETKGGFQIISRGLPVIRSIEIEPWWIFATEDFVGAEDEAISREIEESLKFRTKTIGPTAPPENLIPITFLDTIQGYIDESVTLEWLSDSVLVSALEAKLDSVRSLIQAEDPSSAKVVLGEMMDIINQATSSQITPEARGLLFFNIQYLKNELPDTYIPPVKTLSIMPDKATLPIGNTHTLTITSKMDGKPLPYCRVTVQVTSGPNEGLILEGDPITDDNGQAVFTYTSTKVGTDSLVAQSIVVPSSLPSSGDVLLAMNDVNEVRSDIVPAQGIILAGNSTASYESTEAHAEVTWTGGADLTIPLFIPPLIKTEGGNLIYITDITENRGTIAAGSSITRYYISEYPIIDPEVDRPLGERSIPALGPGESSRMIELEIQIPNDLTAGTYYCGACADADNTVAELGEENNCANNELAIAMPVERTSNQPPDCTSAQPSPDILWPPNHKLKTISILGIADPDGDPVNITVTGITQDEPVNGMGDGDTSPDGFGIGTAQVQVRSERSGTGNGRVYTLIFTADDENGGLCTGQVAVGAPHDQGKGKVPIDDGQDYDSTQP